MCGCFLLTASVSATGKRHVGASHSLAKAQHAWCCTHALGAPLSIPYHYPQDGRVRSKWSFSTSVIFQISHLLKFIRQAFSGQIRLQIRDWFICHSQLQGRRQQQTHTYAIASPSLISGIFLFCVACDTNKQRESPKQKKLVFHGHKRIYSTCSWSTNRFRHLFLKR